MNDLIPKGQGNSRFLRSSIPANIAFQDFVSMLRNGTLPIDFAGLNPDGILQMGTPINKATLLTDDTGSALGLEADERTVNNAFTALLQNGAKNLHYVEYLTSTNWIAPENISGKAIVICVGGGGGGGGNNNADSGGGGGSGYIEIESIDIIPGQTYQIVIGAGGAGGIGNTGTVQKPATDGEDGGATSFSNLITAQGGHGGKKGSTSLGGDGEAGGGAGGRSSAQAGRNGGNGRTYGGGGGAGYGAGKGGDGGTYGAGGGAVQRSASTVYPGSSAGASGFMSGQPFSDNTLVYGSHSTELSINGTDGYGGHNGSVSGQMATAGWGGAGYGSNGGNTASTYYGGGGGGGFGGKGGAGSAGGGGGGGGYFGAGGDGSASSNGKPGSRGGGGGGAGAASSGSTYYSGGNGGSGVCAIIYSTRGD